jgi:rod shape-determining protein MreD
MELRASFEQHIEVHKFRNGAVLLAAASALVLQAFLPIYIHRAEVLELPLLITVYFGLSRRNPSTGLLLGTAIGLLQDSLSAGPLGLYGISKTLVGYVASSIGTRLDTEHPLSRFALTIGFFALQQSVLILTERLLLAQVEPIFSMPMLIRALINGAIAVGLFALLDRLRKS